MTGTANLCVAFATQLPQVPGALCKGVDPRLFDDHVRGETKGQRADRHTVAKSICEQCPAKELCLSVYRELSANRRATTGVWGGTVFASSRGDAI